MVGRDVWSSLEERNETVSDKSKPQHASSDADHTDRYQGIGRIRGMN
jgi:hypothetical protein